MSSNLIKMAEHVKMQGKHIDEQSELLYESIKYVEEVAKEVRSSKEQIMKVGEFVIDFYNEYREHDALSMAQVKELKEAQHYVTSTITRILSPRLQESHKRGSDYLKVWNTVNKGIWSIFKQNVNGVKVPYDRTPKVKFKQAVAYVYSLTVADYLAYKDARWSDIREFTFTPETGEEKMTIDRVVGYLQSPDSESNDGNPTTLH